MRKQSIIVHHGEVHAVDQDKDAHQQAQGKIVLHLLSVEILGSFWDGM